MVAWALAWLRGRTGTGVAARPHGDAHGRSHSHTVAWALAWLHGRMGADMAAWPHGGAHVRKRTGSAGRVGRADLRDSSRTS
eukprot:355485-Chlamydomonas_euryale.AAC.4